MKIRTIIQCVCSVAGKWNSEKIFTIIENKRISIITINCREQMAYNWGNWWIMHLHHIGLPPATNDNLIVLVSGNSFNLNSRR